MISELKEFEKLFEEIDKNLNLETHIYIIGGAVMLYHGLKRATKDVDMIVASLEEFNQLGNALKQIGFKAQILPAVYKKFDLSKILVKQNHRIDLFQKTVCKGFSLSEDMKKRATRIHNFKNLKIYLCSLTDIFMFKTLTERPGDIDDCKQLIKENIDWDAMIKEIQNQIKTAKKPVWITYIGERLDLMIEEGMTIPIMNKINKHRVKFYDDLEKKL